MDYSILEEETKEVFFHCFVSSPDSWFFFLFIFKADDEGETGEEKRKRENVLMVIKMQQGTFLSLFLYSSSYHRPTPSLPAAPVDPSAAATTTIRSSLKSPHPHHHHHTTTRLLPTPDMFRMRKRNRREAEREGGRVRKHPGVFKGLLQSYF